MKSATLIRAGNLVALDITSHLARQSTNTKPKPPTPTNTKNHPRRMGRPSAPHHFTPAKPRSHTARVLAPLLAPPIPEKRKRRQA